MQLFAEVCRAADNVVAPVVKFSDKARDRVKFDPVSDCKWVGAFDSLYAEVAFDFTCIFLAVGIESEISTSGFCY